MSATTEHAAADPHRQRIVAVPGARRARLTAAPGSQSEPLADPFESDDAPAGPADETGPNDTRLLREVPPHY